MITTANRLFLQKLGFISLIWVLMLISCQNDGLQRNEAAPDFEAWDVIAQKKVRLSDHRGKVVMLYFWADWCPACKKEFPMTEAYYKELIAEKGKNFALLAINYKQEQEASEKFAQEYSITFPMLTDPEGKIAALYGIDDRLPTNYFINPEGKVIRKIMGWVEKNQVSVMIAQHKK
jgi:cytochrome c biogenesis protein CcmG, thiol:disulfide interchange protein DsbE